MKKIFILFALMIVFIGSYSQNYQSINPNKAITFSDQQGMISVLTIDSTKTDTELMLYPHRTIGSIGTNCLSLDAPSWVGKEIIIRPDGENIYFNKEGDSIIIKTQASLHDKWTIWQSLSGAKADAEVTEISKNLIIDQMDSTKTIRIKIYNSYGQLSDSVFLSLSQNFGWTSVINFNLFPNLPNDLIFSQIDENMTIVGVSDPQTGIQNLTWFEVFDFQPGDVVHTLSLTTEQLGLSLYSTKKNEVISTYLSRENYADSLVYMVARIYRTTNTQQGKTEQTITSDTIKSTITANPGFDLLPGDPFFHGYETATINSQFYRNNQTLKYPCCASIHYNSDRSCWQPVIDGYSESYFIKGLGGPYSDYSEFSNSQKNKVVFYKKGKAIWGTPFEFLAIDNQITTKTKVFFNSFLKRIEIITDAGQIATPIHLRLYTLSGQVVLTSHSQISGSRIIETPGINPGPYLYQLYTDQSIFHTGKIIIQ